MVGIRGRGGNCLLTQSWRGFKSGAWKCREPQGWRRFPGSKKSRPVSGQPRTGLASNGVSRILFPLSRDGDHLSHSVSRVPDTVMPGATITRGLPPAFARKKSGQLIPLLCLAPHGVFHATSLTRSSGGLLPHLFTLTRRASCQWSVLSCQSHFIGASRR
jgi:hypothetical protein